MNATSAQLKASDFDRQLPPCHIQVFKLYIPWLFAVLFNYRHPRFGKRVIKKSLVPNVITAAGLICGLFVIFKMNMTEPGESDYKVVLGSALILLAAAAADYADGAVARLLRAESSFGGVFDALSDAITFGVAPVVMVLKTLSPQQGSLTSHFVTFAAMLYALCGVLRLVRYSVLPLPQEPEGEFFKLLPMLRRKSFIGLPITLAASALASLNLYLASQKATVLWPNLCRHRERPLGAAMILLAYLMISRLKFFSLKGVQIKRVPPFSAIFASTALAASFLMGLNYNVPLVCVGCTWGYIGLALSFSGYYLVRGKRSKALADQAASDLVEEFEHFS